MSLFNIRNVTLHSGAKSDWIIDCEALTDDDLATLARIASAVLPPFEQVIGVPKGGLRFAAALGCYAARWPGEMRRVLICDDVLTTGSSMEDVRQSYFPMPEWGVAAEDQPTRGWVYGVVIFARGSHQSWIRPIWTLPEVTGGRVPRRIR